MLLNFYGGFWNLELKKSKSAQRLIYFLSEILEDKISERIEYNGGLTCEVSERSNDCIGTIFVLFWIKNSGFLVMTGLKNKLVLKRNQCHGGKTCVLLGQWMLVSWDEDLTVINKKSTLLRRNLLENILSTLAYRNCGTGVSRPHLKVVAQIVSV